MFLENGERRLVVIIWYITWLCRMTSHGRVPDLSLAYISTHWNCFLDWKLSFQIGPISWILRLPTHLSEWCLKIGTRMVTARHRGKKKVVLRMVIRKASALAKNVFPFRNLVCWLQIHWFYGAFLGGRMAESGFSQIQGSARPPKREVENGLKTFP